MPVTSSERNRAGGAGGSGTGPSAAAGSPPSASDNKDGSKNPARRAGVTPSSSSLTRGSPAGKPTNSPSTRRVSGSGVGSAAAPSIRRVSGSGVGSNHWTSSAVTGSPTSAGSPGSIRGRSPSFVDKTNSPASPTDLAMRRRRLSQSYGGTEPSEADRKSPAPQAQTVTEHVRELGFSALTSSSGMDTDRKTQIGRCSITYSCSSHPGNDPGGFQKDNQDAWVVKENFGNTKGIYFGVFDGHGYEGRKVSHAIVNKLPKMLTASHKFKAGRFGEAAAHACIDCNSALKRISSINSELSGSTGIMAYLNHTGNQLTVANVGDSRCILGKAFPGMNTEAIAISVDHTPTIPEEAARVKQHRGRIASFTHMGKPVGPLRVWLPDRDVPGLCMTRSFGDNVAATVGVYAKPDIHEVTLAAEDKYLILCSDGLTEFITNDEMVAMVHKFVTSGLSLSEVCRRLVRESRRRWQHEEDEVVDDCTIIVILLEQGQGVSAPESENGGRKATGNSPSATASAGSSRSLSSGMRSLSMA